MLMDSTFTNNLQLVGIFFLTILIIFFMSFSRDYSSEAHGSTVEEAIYWDGHGNLFFLIL